jgi:hypothetical protein
MMDDEAFIAALARVAPELVVYAAKLIVRAQALDTRRANDAERQRRHVISRASRENDLSLSSSSLEQHTQKEESKRERAPNVMPVRSRYVTLGRSKSLLPDNWQPEDVNPSDRVELEKMRDWAKANAIVKADWAATWRNWKRRAPQFNGKGNGDGKDHSLSAAYDRLSERIGESEMDPFAIENGHRGLPKG